jgi:two-component system cell cycle response regulator DivK
VSNALILVVEDDEKNMKLMRHLLQYKGYRTLEATSAGAGVALAREHHPDLILMDIQLPDFDGVTALQLLRADPATKAIRVMAVSASVMPEDRSRVLNAGFDGFQGKPVKIAEFSEAVAKMLAGTGSAT